MFRETLKKAGVMDELFDQFSKLLSEQGLITREGSIVDATFVDVPKQRNHRDENRKIKEGTVPEEWKKPENKHKLCQIAPFYRKTTSFPRIMMAISA